jgi:hypothetical protein
LFRCCWMENDSELLDPKKKRACLFAFHADVDLNLKFK